MPRNLLFLAVIAALFWAGRNFWSKFLPGAKSSAARRPAQRGKETPAAIDLVRDEKTGEYRVKEDS